MYVLSQDGKMPIQVAADNNNNSAVNYFINGCKQNISAINQVSNKIPRNPLNLTFSIICVRICPFVITDALAMLTAA